MLNPPITETCLCLSCVVAIQDIVQVVYLRDGHYDCICDCCDSCYRPVYVYAVLAELASFVPTSYLTFQEGARECTA